MRSLRRRLLAWLVAPLVVVGVVAATGADLFLERRLTAAYDLDLGDIARALVPYLRTEGGRVELQIGAQSDSLLRADSTDQISYAVFDSAGRAVAGDPDLSVPPPSRGEGLSFWDDVHKGRPVRAAALDVVVGGVPVKIVAMETRRKRERASRDALLSAIVPATLLSLAAMGAIVVGVRRGLGPVEKLRDELQSRSHVDLRPIDESHVVDELRPLIGELNNMLSRLDSAQRTQARFIANAAHQLRTPIAGLVTQLDLARGQESGYRIHLDQAREAAARLARLAQQILSLAAADPTSNPRTDRGRPCDLAQIVKDHADPWIRAATQRGVELEFDLAPVSVDGDALLIGELVSNLVDNAIRYGAHTVFIATHTADTRAILTVSDDGPGIPVAERTRIFERFYRLDKESTGGSGLGLAIVNEIAQRHGASVEVGAREDGSGTRVTVTFARAG